MPILNAALFRVVCKLVIATKVIILPADFVSVVMDQRRSENIDAPTGEW
jgi:hypothetical protein